jgi:nitrate reductase gamma subunit
MAAIQYLTLISVVVAVAAMIIKALRYANAPQSMRWELYPVPHEKGKAECGGSYLEELDWWTKPRRKDLFNELKEMASEVIFLKGVFHHNRPLWRSSMPFHFGLYLCVGWLLLLLVGAVVESGGTRVSPHSLVSLQILYYLTAGFGYAGLALSGLGALGLLVWRTSDAGQRKYSSPIDYFNLICFIVVSVVALAAHLTADPGHVALRSYVHGTITLTPLMGVGTLMSWEIVLISLLIMWIPLTRMSHFVAKYFLYHSVRWEDEPNVRGGKLDQVLQAQLARKVGWSAPHISSEKTWGEVVTETTKDE